MRRKNAIGVMLNCNDYRNGEFMGRIEGLSIRDEIEVHNFDVPMDVGKHAIVIGWRVFPIEGYATWVGNWCWDMAWMRRPIAKRLIRYLALLDADLDVADERVWRVFEKLKENPL